MTRSAFGGTTLLELLLGFGVFMLFLGGMFALFTHGYQAFHFLSARQGVQGELLRLKTVLQADLGATHFRSLGVQQRTTSVGAESVRRDQVCCLTLRDWKDPASYDSELSIPLWDRYVVYRASLEKPSLTRLSVQPNDPIPFRIRPLEGFMTIGEETAVSQTVLSSQVRSFACELDRAMQEVVVTFLLESVGGKRGLDESTVGERFEAKLRWTPSNTVPRF
jgi:hypothetical protein